MLYVYIKPSKWKSRSKTVPPDPVNFISSKWDHTLHLPIKIDLSSTYCKNDVVSNVPTTVESMWRRGLRPIGGARERTREAWVQGEWFINYITRHGPEYALGYGIV